MTDPAPTAAPVAEKQRHDVLDSLRGVALFGVLLVNLRDFSLYGLLTAEAREALPTAALDRALDVVMAALIDIKAATLFSLLFGVGFALQMQRAGTDGDATTRYLRRLLLLLLIGIAHAWLLWWGDILRYYAMLGLLLVPLGRCTARQLAIAGAVVALFALPLLRPWIVPLLPGLMPADQAAAAAFAAFSGDQVGDALAANLDYDLRMRLANWSLAFFVLGRLLLGAALGFAGVLQQPQQHLHFWRRLLQAGAGAGVALTAFVLLRDHGLLFADGWWTSTAARSVSSVLRSASSIAMALAYMAALVLLFQQARWRRLLLWFAPVGRMALSNYLGQSLLGILLFYGIGLGLGPRLGLSGIVLATLLIYSTQVWLSRLWLRRFRFGPAEWLWRSATYGRLQPMRRLAAA
ncbi:uncharacterized protein DFR29_101166 [Tahibacter aquaticus]|uniref:DUF418 domain-containing protein n=1 Tax=Tahibacter aquaticus TaxID=520092 RepID=A0A4V3DNI1_9GAMM|nr:DUF418 domain-containing protein [Tahibacter aquaticus]TDR48546.1 uncharacterized protein DFR29_101166 [Tahibacter aquaticus]